MVCVRGANAGGAVINRQQQAGGVVGRDDVRRQVGNRAHRRYLADVLAGTIAAINHRRAAQLDIRTSLPLALYCQLIVRPVSSSWPVRLCWPLKLYYSTMPAALHMQATAVQVVARARYAAVAGDGSIALTQNIGAAADNY
jgi:hypothetical protein